MDAVKSSVEKRFNFLVKTFSICTNSGTKIQNFAFRSLCMDQLKQNQCKNDKLSKSGTKITQNQKYHVCHLNPRCVLLARFSNKLSLNCSVSFSLLIFLRSLKIHLHNFMFNSKLKIESKNNGARKEKKNFPQ